MSESTDGRKIKCVVWDLDNTLWDGILLEGDKVQLRPGAREAVETLDKRGILQSVASKNDEALAMAKLTEFGLADYFLYPQIHFDPKSASVKRIRDSINIGMDTIAFVDDQPFERDEVKFAHPDVLSLDAAELPNLLAMPEMNPRFITEDSALRRRLYQDDIRRNKIEKDFSGTQEEFLATLGMRFTIDPARESDLQRAVELTERTHQLNTTGRTYDYDDLNTIRSSPRHKLYVNALEDKYGPYGKIGLTLVECDPDQWTIRLLLMSCRVMSRGVGSIMIHFLRGEAKKAGVRLLAEFVETDRNRMMYVTYKFAGFREIERNGSALLLENDLKNIPAFPAYVDVRVGS